VTAAETKVVRNIFYKYWRLTARRTYKSRRRPYKPQIWFLVEWMPVYLHVRASATPTANPECTVLYEYRVAADAAEMVDRAGGGGQDLTVEARELFNELADFVNNPPQQDTRLNVKDPKIRAGDVVHRFDFPPTWVPYRDMKAHENLFRLMEIADEFDEMEAARVEAARVEAARVEAVRVEAARVEAARAETARVEATDSETESELATRKSRKRKRDTAEEDGQEEEQEKSA
jgi:hypothetical protein